MRAADAVRGVNDSTVRSPGTWGRDGVGCASRESALEIRRTAPVGGPCGEAAVSAATGRGAPSGDATREEPSLRSLTCHSSLLVCGGADNTLEPWRPSTGKHHVARCARPPTGNSGCLASISRPMHVGEPEFTLRFDRGPADPPPNVRRLGQSSSRTLADGKLAAISSRFRVGEAPRTEEANQRCRRLRPAGVGLGRCGSERRGGGTYRRRRISSFAAAIRGGNFTKAA